MESLFLPAHLQLFDRNLTATGCLSLSLSVPLRELEPDKSAVLSAPIPPSLPLSLKENDYESEGRRFESCRAQSIVYVQLFTRSSLRINKSVITRCVHM